MKTDWNNINEVAKQRKKLVGLSQDGAEFMKNFPEEGYMRERKGGKIVKLDECKDSTLRRYIQFLNNLYVLYTDTDTKNKILKKKIEIELILNKSESK